MVSHNYSSNIQEIMVGFSLRGPEWKLNVGTLREGHTFVKNQTFLVPKGNHKVLWNILQSIVEIPKIETDPQRKEPAKMDIPVKDLGNQEQVPSVPPISKIIHNTPVTKPVSDPLEALSAREIIEKVKKDTGVLITIGPKSKARILKRAHEIYSSTAKKT